MSSKGSLRDSKGSEGGAPTEDPRHPLKTSQDDADESVNRRLSVLISFAFGARTCMESLRPDWEVMLDSGAFTNWSRGKDVVTMNGYMGFLLEHGHRFSHYLNLDRIGDPAKSQENLEYLQGVGLSPVPVFQRGGTRAELERLLDEHDLVAIGGISKTPQAKAEQAYLHQCMSIARGHKVHLLGVGWGPILKYRPYSADCSTYAQTRMYGSLALWHRGGWVRFGKAPTTRGSKAYVRPDTKRTSALHAYGLTWADLGDADAWAKEGPVALAGIRGWIRFAAHAQRMGSRVVFVDHQRIHSALTQAWEMEREAWT